MSNNNTQRMYIAGRGEEEEEREQRRGRSRRHHLMNRIRMVHK